MNSFFKSFLALALATLFLSGPANAFATDILAWAFEHNRLDHLYNLPKIDVYGDVVSYPSHSYVYGYPYRHYGFYPVYSSYRNVFYKVNPSTDIRNIQNQEDIEKRESQYNIKVNNSQSSQSTMRVVSRNTPSDTIVTTPNQGWVEVTPTESFLEENLSESVLGEVPNSLFFAAEESEISCGTVSFVFDAIDAESMQSTEKKLYLKNTSSQDFFVDSVFVNENEAEFNAFGTVLDKKIPENDQGRIRVTVDVFRIENDLTDYIDVSVKGHFESEKTCSVEKNFLVGVKGENRDYLDLHYDFDFPSKIELTDSGFLPIYFDNPSDKELVISISSSSDAIVFPNRIVVPPKSVVNRVVSVNQATENEFIYYALYSQGRMLEENFSKIVFPQEELQPVEHVLREDGSVKIVGYSSKVMFVNGKTDISLALKNTGFQAKEVLIELVNPPQGVVFNPIVLRIEPNQIRNINLEALDFGISEFPFNAILTVSFDDKQLSRQIVFEKQSTQVSVVQQGTIQDSFMGFVSTGFFSLQNNALTYGAILLFLAIVLFLVVKILFPGNQLRNQTWAARRANQ